MTTITTPPGGGGRTAAGPIHACWSPESARVQPASPKLQLLPDCLHKGSTVSQTRFPKSSAAAHRAPQRKWLDFDKVRVCALSNAHVLCRELLPDGQIRGSEYVARNPLRDDRRPGSFKINLRTGAWADFASDARGNDLIGLVGYVRQTDRVRAAQWIDRQFGAIAGGAK